MSPVSVMRSSIRKVLTGRPASFARTWRTHVVAATAALTVLGCRPTPPDVVFADFESRLLAAETLAIDFHVTAEGAVSADLDGKLEINASGGITLDADGTFDGEPASLRLATQGGRYTYGNATRRTLANRPPELQRALLIGFTRMGILHNLARLAEEESPDHADGGVTDWVEVRDFEAVRLPRPGIAFAIVVAGEPAGSAALDLDSTAMPLERRQTVQFPSGEMRVTETYPAIVTQP